MLPVVGLEDALEAVPQQAVHLMLVREVAWVHVMPLVETTVQVVKALVKVLVLILVKVLVLILVLEIVLILVLEIVLILALEVVLGHVLILVLLYVIQDALTLQLLL